MRATLPRRHAATRCHAARLMWAFPCAALGLYEFGRRRGHSRWARGTAGWAHTFFSAGQFAGRDFGSSMSIILGPPMATARAGARSAAPVAPWRLPFLIKFWHTHPGEKRLFTFFCAAR